MSKTNRREFLFNSATLLAAPMLLPILSGPIAAAPRVDPGNRVSSLPSGADTQSEWRWCQKCYCLFWNGSANKGRCQAGGGHSMPAGGRNFFLPYGQLTDTATAQINWRFCTKCFAMFFDGRADKGRCPAGAGHAAQGFNFRLPHDIASDAYDLGGWRYCGKCTTMFWDADPAKGSCSAGGGHGSAGYSFVLPHSLPSELHLRSTLSTDGWAPISGWVDILAKSNGDYVFSGHVHNSGAINIRYTLAAVVMSPSGQAFGFGVNGHKVDGTETLFGRNRDHNWEEHKNDQRIAEMWNMASRSTLSWRLVASDTIGERIEGFLENMARNALAKIAQAADASPQVRGAKAYMNLVMML